MKTKINIISGFLGAGKTTLIKKLISNSHNNERVAIIENEFGEVGIDGDLLKRNGNFVKEINSGCICCSLIGDFTNAIKELINNYCPDRIIIEPSGVAMLSDVIKACQANELKDLTEISVRLTVVDASKFHIHIRNFNEFYEDQIKSASIICLTRIDKISSEKLHEIIHKIRELNEGVHFITTPISELSLPKIWDLIENGDAEMDIFYSSCCFSEKLNNIRGQDGCKCGSHKHNIHSAIEVFQFWTEISADTYSFDKLKNITNQLMNYEHYGDIVRGKGIFKTDDGWKKFDFVSGELILQDTEPDFTGRLCIIGAGLKKDAISRLFQEVKTNE